MFFTYSRKPPAKGQNLTVTTGARLGVTKLWSCVVRCPRHLTTWYLVLDDPRSPGLHQRRPPPLLHPNPSTNHLHLRPPAPWVMTSSSSQWPSRPCRRPLPPTTRPSWHLRSLLFIQQQGSHRRAPHRLASEISEARFSTVWWQVRPVHFHKSLRVIFPSVVHHWGGEGLDGILQSRGWCPDVVRPSPVG
jgi:hypothetical protein